MSHCLKLLLNYISKFRIDMTLSEGAMAKVLVFLTSRDWFASKIHNGHCPNTR